MWPRESHISTSSLENGQLHKLTSLQCQVQTFSLCVFKIYQFPSCEGQCPSATARERLVHDNTLTYFTHNKVCLLWLGTPFAHLTLVLGPLYQNLLSLLIAQYDSIFRPFTPNEGKVEVETLNNMQFPVNHFIQLKSTDLQSVGLGRRWAQGEGV